MPSRQQRRAKARAPIRRKRRGSALFVASLLVILLFGGVAAGIFRSQTKPITRGAIVGEHWHAKYRIDICGKSLTPFPFVEGEIHSHGDGVIHDHPATQAYAGENANLANFFRIYETALGKTADGKNSLVLSDGSHYSDGETCPGSKKKYDLELIVNGKSQKGDIGKYTMKNNDDIVIRFGPKATATTANPNGPAQVVPENGAPVQAPSTKPQASTAPKASSEPKTSAAPAG